MAAVFEGAARTGCGDASIAPKDRGQSIQGRQSRIGDAKTQRLRGLRFEGLVGEIEQGLAIEEVRAAGGGCDLWVGDAEHADLARNDGVQQGIGVPVVTEQGQGSFGQSKICRFCQGMSHHRLSVNEAQAPR